MASWMLDKYDVDCYFLTSFFLIFSIIKTAVVFIIGCSTVAPGALVHLCTFGAVKFKYHKTLVRIEITYNYIIMLLYW